MIKLKNLLKESTWANRKFGEPLPTMADYKKAHNEEKLTELNKNEGEHIFKHVIRVGTQITYQMKVVYIVTKVYPGGFLMRIYKDGDNPGMFAPKARIEKDNYESQVKMGFIKGVK